MEYGFDGGILLVSNYPVYSEVSFEVLAKYDKTYDFAGDYQASSRHGVVCRTSNGKEHSLLLLAGGGATVIHDTSVTVIDGTCYLAIGDTVCCLALPDLSLQWAKRADAATCFGVYYSAKHQCVIVHGELDITSLSLTGDILWSKSGADIFSEGFSIFDDYVEAVDFNKRIYRFDIASGLEDSAS